MISAHTPPGTPVVCLNGPETGLFEGKVYTVAAMEARVTATGHTQRHKATVSQIANRRGAITRHEIVYSLLTRLAIIMYIQGRYLES